MDESSPAHYSDGRSRPGRLLLDVLAEPERMAELSLPEWDTLLRIGERTGLLSKLAMQVENRGFGPKIPPPVVPHIQSAVTLGAACRRSMDWEFDRLRAALAGIASPIVLLKGAAYALCEYPFAAGRLSADLDMLVSAASLPQVEQGLMKHGWVVHEENPMHEAYFRRWLHELPPLIHRERQTIIDVHHTILPRTDRLRVNPQLLLDAAVPIANSSFCVLAPVDMVLHCATHLFRNGDFTHGLRDLCDLDGLLRQFSQADGFWDELLQRAPLLDLTIPCSHALRYVVMYLNAPVPPPVLERMDSWRPRWPTTRMMDRVVDRALLPRDPLRREPARKLAIWWLQFWPPPRWRTVFTWVFWSKRLTPLKFWARHKNEPVQADIAR